MLESTFPRIQQLLLKGAASKECVFIERDESEE